MESLDDPCLIMVFKLVNLNDRASLRLVIKRFRTLCDTILINKLIVFEKSAVQVDQLAYTKEWYGYEHTASCFDLQKLFSNKTLLNQMRRLRVLVIKGTRIPATSFDLDAKFDELDYLSLNMVLLNDSKILQSDKLKHLILEQVYLKNVNVLNAKMQQMARSGQSVRNNSPLVYAFGFDNLRSKSLKYLLLMPSRPLDFDFFQFGVQNKLFDSLEELDVTVSNLKSLILLSENCANIKVISAIMSEVGKLFELIDSTDMSSFFSRIGTNQNLKLYLFGIEFNQQTATEVRKFLESFGPTNIRVNCSKLDCMINNRLYEVIKKFEKKHDLTRFYRLINEVYFEDLIKDEKFCQRFGEYCDTLRFELKEEPNAKLANYFDYVPRVKCIRIGIYGLREIMLSNALLAEIPKRAPHIFVFMLDCKNSALKFDFLFKFEQLVSIVLNTTFEFPQNVYIDLIRKMKYLFRLDVRYASASAANREQLRAFKKRVLDCLHEKKLSNLDFKINIHKKTNNSFVRYDLAPKELKTDVEEEEKLFAWSQVHWMKSQFPGGGYSTVLNLRDLMGGR